MVAPRLAALGALLSLLAGVTGRKMTASPKKNFVPLRPVASDSTITLTLALPSSDMDGLHTKLADISDPASANYGKWLSKDEVEAFVAPTTESVQAVNSWLAQYNLTSESASPAGELLRINVPAHVANQIFAANFTEYNETVSATTQIGTLSYTIPEDVSDHITFAYPTTQFIPPIPKGKKMVEAVVAPSNATKRATAPSDCSSQIYPTCLFDLYNMPNSTTSHAGNGLATGQFLGEMANIDDLEAFYAQYRPGVGTPGYTIWSIDGGITSGTSSLEASLDTQYTLGLATGIPYTLISDGSASVQGFIDMANVVASQSSPPPVLSISYGFDENDFLGSEDVANQLCNSFAAATARGVSIMICSGDNGVWSFSYDSQCSATSSYGPTFPSGCPYVTSVGGTQGIPETSASFSGGGFSNIFAQPSYQSSAVSSYISSLGGQNSGLYNPSGRAFPDVSAQSVNFLVDVGGTWYYVLGTSASTPTFATVIALINDQRLAEGKSTLGFLNPLLYANPSALNDITTGSNPGCASGGFPAKSGWDPVTGLGTPDYQRLLSVALAQP